MISFWIKNKLWRKGTASLLAASLLFTIVAPPFAQASIWDERKKSVDNLNRKLENEDPGFFQGRALKAPGINFDSKIAGIDLPKELGAVTESWNGNGSSNSDVPLVVHIQDAHGFYGAQKNAVEILRLLAESRAKGESKNQAALQPASGASRPPLTVCIEGAWGEVRPDWLGAFPDKAVKKDVAESLLKRGGITGEEYLEAVKSPGTVRIQGVESR